MHLLFRYVLYCATIFLLSRYLNGFLIDGSAVVQTVLIVSAFVLALDLTVKPVISLLTLPINIFTLGLFSLIINALLLWAVAWYVPRFDILYLSTAFIGALVLSIIKHLFGYK